MVLASACPRGCYGRGRWRRVDLLLWSCLSLLAGVLAQRALPPGLASNPLISRHLINEDLDGITNQLSQCLAHRVGPETAANLDIQDLLSQAGRGRKLATSPKESYVVLLRSSAMDNRLPSEVFESHGLTRIKPLVTMNGTVASSLVEDAQVALAVPLTSAFKTEPSLTTTLDTMGTADLGEDAAKEDSGSSSIDMVSFHITLADTDNVGETLSSWRDSFSLLDLNTSQISLEASDAPLSGALASRYVVVKAPASQSKVLVDLLSVQPQVDWIEKTPRLTTWNKWARGVTQTGDWQLTPITAAGYYGKGQIVGVADTGVDLRTCFLNDPDVPPPYDTISHKHRKMVTYIGYADRKENYDNKPHSEDPIGHGTHVCTTVAGETIGRMGEYNGMAVGSKIAFFDMARYDNAGNVELYPPYDLNMGLFTRLYEAGARVFSMSWGSPDSNCYSSYAVMVDEFHWQHPDAIVVFAAGNSGQEGDYSVVTPSTAKNCLTVGASYNMMQTTFQLENNLNYVAYFSSSGPTSDGRLKPDILAPGYYITSADNREVCGVVNSRGTSMATPVVAGNLALIREYFMTGGYQGQPLLPSGALLKAFIIQSGLPMTSYEDAQGVLRKVSYPDNHQGYGRMSLDQVIDFGNRFTMVAYGSANQTDPRYREVARNGDLHQYQVTIVNATKIRALKATLVWTDRPSSASACRRSSGTVLSNDLDLRIVGPEGEIILPVSTQGQKPDRMNNVEQVIVELPMADANYTIEVYASNLVSAQSYALVFTGQFAGFSYNQTLGELDTRNMWTSVKNFLVHNKKTVILVGVVAALSVWLIIGFTIYLAKAREAREHRQQERYSSNRIAPEPRARGPPPDGLRVYMPPAPTHI